MASDGIFLFKARLERLRKRVNPGSYPTYLFTSHMTSGKVPNFSKTQGFVYEMGIIIHFFTAQIFTKHLLCMKPVLGIGYTTINQSKNPYLPSVDSFED